MHGEGSGKTADAHCGCARYESRQELHAQYDLVRGAESRIEELPLKK